MNKIELSDKQKIILESLNNQRIEAEKRLNEINNEISMVSTLIFDFNQIDLPQKMIYENGVISYS